MQTTITYKDAGVDIEAGDLLVEKIKPFAKRTLRPEVFAGIGGFGAMFDIGRRYNHPVLVSGTDGVGTKLRLAFELNRHGSIGIDLVAMSVNDILVQGAEPLFFLDYFACGELDITLAADVIRGIASGCELSNCSLIGGETAEMPGMYPSGEYDLAGFAVGVVEKDAIIDGASLDIDDVIIGLSSSGFHSNGYSLIRKLIKLSLLDLNSSYDGVRTWGEAIMEPTTIYVKPILELLKKIKINGMSHITGGGITGNLPRIFPPHLAAEINIPELPDIVLFNWARDVSKLSQLQLLETFNCGIGYALIVNKAYVSDVINLMEQYSIKSYIIGKMIKRVNNEIDYKF